MKRLPRSFFARDTHMVAKQLLGKVLVHKSRGKTTAARIFEVEAYVGEKDLASHARFGKTKRNEIMFGEAGHAYIYLIYGMHNMLNVVTDKQNFPAAILIRSAILWEGRPHSKSGASLAAAKLLAGPGKLTRALGITRTLNGEDVTTSERLYVADDGWRMPRNALAAAPRIGVEYAGIWARKYWRYYIDPSVSPKAGGGHSK